MADKTYSNTALLVTPVATKSAVIKAGEAAVKKGAALHFDASTPTYLVHASDTSGEKFAGFALQDGSAGDTIQYAALGIIGPVTHSVGSLTNANIGDKVYFSDDQTVTNLATATNDVVGGEIYEVLSATTVKVLFGYNRGITDVDTLQDLLATIGGAAIVGYDNGTSGLEAETTQAAIDEILADLAAVTATNGLNMLGYQDAGGHTDAADGDAALDEIYGHIHSTSHEYIIPVNCAVVNNGTALTDFADAESDVPGLWSGSGAELAGVRWNDHAAPLPIQISLPKPSNLDATADAEIILYASKSGATIGDATTFAVGVFENNVGALYDADATFGGTTDAMTGDATAKTVQTVSVTLANANISATDGTFTVTIAPSAGLLGTDDVILHGARLRYKGATI